MKPGSGRARPSQRHDHRSRRSRFDGTRCRGLLSDDVEDRIVGRVDPAVEDVRRGVNGRQVAQDSSRGDRHEGQVNMGSARVVERRDRQKVARRHPRAGALQRKDHLPIRTDRPKRQHVVVRGHVRHRCDTGRQRRGRWIGRRRRAIGLHEQPHPGARTIALHRERDRCLAGGRVLEAARGGRDPQSILVGADASAATVIAPSPWHWTKAPRRVASAGIVMLAPVLVLAADRRTGSLFETRFHPAVSSMGAKSGGVARSGGYSPNATRHDAPRSTITDTISASAFGSIGAARYSDETALPSQGATAWVYGKSNCGVRTSTRISP